MHRGRLGQGHGLRHPHLTERHRIEPPVGIGDRGPVGNVDRDDHPPPHGPGSPASSRSEASAARFSAAYSSSSMSSERYHSRNAGVTAYATTGPAASSPVLYASARPERVRGT